MMVIVRRRHGMISEVRPSDGDDGVMHLVRLGYRDGDSPPDEQLLWEREPHRELLQPAALLRVADPPMPSDDLDAVV